MMRMAAPMEATPSCAEAVRMAPMLRAERNVRGAMITKPMITITRASRTINSGTRTTRRMRPERIVRGPSEAPRSSTLLMRHLPFAV